MPFPIEIDQVRRTEVKLGVTFPKSFVARMLADNGGDIVIEDEAWSLNPFLDWTDKVRLKRTCNDIVGETINAREWSGFPQSGISIASNGMGDHLVLLPDPSQSDLLQPVVFMWSHETGELDKVADDFAAIR